MWLEMYNKSVDSLFLCVCVCVCMSVRERKKNEHVHVVTSGQADKVRLYFQASFCTWGQHLLHSLYLLFWFLGLVNFRAGLQHLSFLLHVPLFLHSFVSFHIQNIYLPLWIRLVVHLRYHAQYVHQVARFHVRVTCWMLISHVAVQRRVINARSTR